jgi:Flp pilus assembly protein TadD
MALQNDHNRPYVLLGLALLAITVVAYLPAIYGGGFVWDDDDYIIHNQTLRDAPGLLQIWINPQATPQYYPLVHTTYWAEYRMWGLKPTGYHVTNVLLHSLVAVLLWRVLKHLEVPGAWLAAALFAVHPVHVESVAWITERKNVLSGVFYLAAALSYLKWTDIKAKQERRPSLYLMAFTFFLAALLSKTVAVTLPAALLLVLWWKGRLENGSIPATFGWDIRSAWSQFYPLLPFFVIGLALSFLTVWLEKYHVGAKGAEWNLSFIDRFLIAGRALWFYASKLLWPLNLSFNYPRWEIDSSVWWQYLFPLSVLGVIAVLWIARKRIGRGPLVAVLFFAGTLLPALGFFDVYPMRYSFVADHFQYLASIGLLTLFSAVIVCGWKLIPQKKENRPVQWLSIGLPVGSLLALLIFLSAKQCGIYQNLETLYLDTIEKNPASWMAYNNLGQLYIKEGRAADAVPLIRQALRHNPQDVDAVLNLGVAMSRLGQPEEAMRQYKKALEIDPNQPQVYSNIGAALARQGKWEAAISSYRKALAIKPDFATHSNLGAALTSLGRFDEAIEEHKKAVALAPELASAHLKFGETLHLAGRVRDAEYQYREAISLDPAIPEAHLNLGMIALEDKLIPAALDHFRRAVKHAPNFADAHRNLAKTLTAVGRFADAEKHFKLAIELEPQSGRTRLDFADFLLNRGDVALARREYVAAAELLSDNPDILFQVGLLDLQMGDVAAAETQFRTVVQRAPGHGPAHNYLAVLIAGQGKEELAEAAALLRTAVKLAPENAEFHNNLGVILVRVGNRDEALKALEEAVRLKPDYAEAIKNRNDLRRLLGDKVGTP